ncbi:tRNA (adenosine(37)-N6)-threonylcarbamoyltransferase complex ATPase subunit type 1 TsaE [Virgibacillus sp. W0430]|uniref:tRNA (adenosine(37)-N6)-threonylcarbamoyltransferase complex ATPase subunit type 1 TsaE n=1 Tax=Virgibacillus sp. W0430 TaxID=3391580 RepID=UPI003F480589
MRSVKTGSEQETIRLAAKLAMYLKPGDVLTLEGDLGVGKTTFTKGIAEGLGIKRVVTSPTFTIVKEYKGELPLYHMDAYRLEHSDEDIGFEEYFSGKGITVVEWAQFIDEFMPVERLNIKIDYVSEHERIVSFNPVGMHYKLAVNALIG